MLNVYTLTVRHGCVLLRCAVCFDMKMCKRLMKKCNRWIDNEEK